MGVFNGCVQRMWSLFVRNTARSAARDSKATAGGAGRVGVQGDGLPVNLLASIDDGAIVHPIP